MRSKRSGRRTVARSPRACPSAPVMGWAKCRSCARAGQAQVEIAHAEADVLQGRFELLSGLEAHGVVQMQGRAEDPAVRVRGHDVGEDEALGAQSAQDAAGGLGVQGLDLGHLRQEREQLLRAHGDELLLAGQELGGAQGLGLGVPDGPVAVFQAGVQDDPQRGQHGQKNQREQAVAQGAEEEVPHGRILRDAACAWGEVCCFRAPRVRSEVCWEATGPKPRGLRSMRAPGAQDGPVGGSGKSPHLPLPLAGRSCSPSVWDFVAFSIAPCAALPGQGAAVLAQEAIQARGA